MGPAFKSTIVDRRVVVMGFETVPSDATLNRTMSEVCGNHSDLPWWDHNGPSAATVPSPMVGSDAEPVPTCWTIVPVFRSTIVRKPVNSCQVNAAR